MQTQRQMVVIPLSLAPFVAAWHLTKWVYQHLLSAKPPSLDTPVEWVKEVPHDAICREFAQLLFIHANATRVAQGLPSLRWNSKLELSAWNWANIMQRTNVFDHAIPGYPTLGDRIRQAGYRYRVCRENLSAIEYPGRTTDDLAERVHSGWCQSPGHWANLISSDVSELGVGVIRSNNRYWAVQNFGSRMSIGHSYQLGPSSQPLPTHKTPRSSTFRYQ